MTPEQRKKVEQLVESAVERPADERRAFLAEALSGDDDLISEFETLIASYEETGEVPLASALAAAIDHTLEIDPPVPVIGRRVGSYEIVREIGRGGMGSVYLAVRADDEFQKRVAIKLIKRGMDTEMVIRRFRNERQILASLDHPYIARLLDGGTTDDGLPYFVMEYVEGQPLHRYCNNQKLTIAERLRLFRKVCSAVHHAHQNLIIHRDLKPGNILVTNERVPKLLDFGIAKILNPEIGSHAIDPVTLAVQMMTPEYASPEQVRGERASAASDVYALGVMLYELLTDHRPYRFRTRLPHEIARIICEEEPERPSVALNIIEVISDGGSEPSEITPESIARARNSAPEHLRRQLAGSLDNIILKALRKEPQRRYRSVDEFSEDLKRYLEGLPVSAPSYFVAPTRRNVEADEPTTGSRSIAVLPFKVMRAEEKGDEFLGMGMADAIITRLSNIRRITVRPTSSVLKYFDGEENILIAGYELDVGYVLDGRVQRAGDRVRVTVQLVRVRDGAPLWAAKFDEKFTDIFTVQDSISEQVAEALIPQLTGEERAMLVKRETANPDAYQEYLKGRYFWNKFSDEGFTKGLEHFNEAIRLDPDYAPAYVGIADCLNWSSIFGMGAPGDYLPQARAAALRALELDDTLGEAHAALGFTTVCYEWDAKAAESMFKRAIELNPNYTSTYQWYSNLLAAQGSFDEAITEVKRAQDINPLSVMVRMMTGWTYYQARRYDLALQELHSSLQTDANFGNSWMILSAVYERKGMLEEAIEAARKSLEVMQGSVIPLWVLGHALGVAGRRSEAESVLDHLKTRAREGYVSPFHVAIVYVGLGDIDRAFEWLERAYECRDQWMLWLGTEPKLDDLRSDPRYKNLLTRVGLARTGETLAEERPAPDLAATGQAESGKLAGSTAEVSGSGGRIQAGPTGVPHAPQTTEIAAPASARPGGGKLWAIMGLAAVLVVLAYAVYRVAFVTSPGQPFIHPKTVKLTTTGSITNAAVSPDGKYIAYTMDEAGKEGLWVRQVAVSNSHRIVSPAEIVYRGLTFSPDGNYVYYVAIGKETGARGSLYQVPAFGGSVRRIREGVDSPVGVSSDGKRLAFVRAGAEGEETLIISGEDAGSEQDVAARAYPDHLSVRSAPAWSPDGSTVACVIESSDSNGFYNKVLEVRVDDLSERILTPQRWITIGQVSWASRNSLIMTAQEGGSSFMHLWHISYPDGSPRKILSDLSDYKGVSLTDSSSALVSVQTQALTNIWIMPKGDPSRGAQITYGAGRYFDLCWGWDEKILYASDVSGSADIWEMETTGSGQNQLTAGAGRNFGPVVSPDGRYILFHSDRSGQWNIWRMDRDGSNPTPLTRGSEPSNWPQVSPDGQWVVYEHVGQGTLATLWRVPLSGGTPERLTTKLCVRPDISPDGSRIACWRKDDAPNAPWQIAVFSFDGGEPLELYDVPQSMANGQSSLHWSEDGKAIIYIDYRQGRTHLMRQPLDGGLPKRLTDFANDLIYSFDIARDGRLALSRALRTADVVLIEDSGTR